MKSKRTQLSGREYFEGTNKLWYELWCERSFDTQDTEKIVVAEIAETNRFALCPPSIFYIDTACGIILKAGRLDTRYVLGLLNSKLMSFYYKNVTVPKANKFFIYKTMYLKRIPIYNIDFSNSRESKLHDELVDLVAKMLELKTYESTLPDGATKRQEFEAEIERTDAAIDALVYDLYGLTEEERRVVEGETGKQ